MPLSRSRDYLSIGEVLDAVQADFPDVSISKIRFLEAEGLIAPERTPSGYRKFYDKDVTRLRYILSLQRDQFMPLKVIRDRLDRIDTNGGAYPEPSSTSTPAATGATAAPAAPAAEAPAPDLSDVAMSRAELLGASGLTEQQLAGLEDFGLLAAPESGSYNGDALAVAKAARGLFAYGLEPRHLRLFRQVADREAGFIEQIVTPALARKDPEAGKQAARSVRELLMLSRQMREALLRSSLAELL